MKKILAILFIFLLVPISCFAKPIIKCDRQTFDPITGLYYLDGNVSVQSNNRLITANKAQVELYSLKVYAQGDIRLVQDDIVFTGDAVSVYGSEKTAVVTGGISFTQGNLNINADKGSFNWSTKDALFEGDVHINAGDDYFAGSTKDTISGNNPNGEITTNKIIYNVRTKKFHD